MPPQLSIADLYSLKNKKDKIKTSTFDVIIEKCHAKIKAIAAQGGMNIFYEIPYIMIGYPLYNINECIEYVVEALRNNGLLVQILPYPNNNNIYISWKPPDIQGKKVVPTLTGTVASDTGPTGTSALTRNKFPFKRLSNMNISVK